MNDRTFAVEIHAPDIDPKHRHPKIFELFDQLKPGEYMHLSNDHNPVPLHYQFTIERGEDAFSWEYLEEGPTLWRVAIQKK